MEWMLTDALEKVLPNRRPEPLQNPHLYVFRDEPAVVQLACRGEGFFRLELRGHAQIRVRRVVSVPCKYPCHEKRDENYLFTEPGNYPDLLQNAPEVLTAEDGWSSFWLDLTALPGDHALTLSCVSPQGEVLQELPINLHVSREALPTQRLLHTQWFHGDCLADYYGVPVFSEAHWRILENFMASAVRHGVNMLLTPIFTPPLDTAVGGERTTIQLVDVEKTESGYSFGFGELDRWIALCEKVGISNLEICHLFTQWGAQAAPKVMGKVDGKEVRLFGWDTPAVGGEYTPFLRQLLMELKDHLREMGWLERTWFHISDEPGEREMPAFAAARASVADLLEDCYVLDATSTYALYEKGLIRIPVVSENDLPPFLENRPEHLWTYYCTAQWGEVPNRFIAMPSARNRILGALLYYFDLEGFLQWGFNFYNSAYSLKHIDPFVSTDADGAFPSGDPFLVYPGENGEPLESIRGAVLQMAMRDHRALCLLEEKTGREAALSLLEDLAGEPLSFTEYPRQNAFFRILRRRLFELTA